MSGFVGWCLELLSTIGPTSARAMMGGHMIYGRGLPVALVWDDRLYLKAGAEEQPAFRDAGCEPFTYELRGRVVEMSFWSAPEAALDDPDAMGPWAARALAAAERAAAAKRGKGAARTKRSAAKKGAAPARKKRVSTRRAPGTSGSRRRPRGRSRS